MKAVGMNLEGVSGGALGVQLERFRSVLGGGMKSLALAGEARRHARVVQVVPLGTGSRLLVVEFGGQKHLLGQSRAGLVQLAAAEREA
jgi:hypothetical protein